MHVHKVHIELLGEDLFDFFRLIFTQKPMIHEHTRELISDRLRTKRGHNGRIHATRKPEDHATVPHLLTDSRNGVLNDRIHLPTGLKPTNIEQEIR